MTTPDAPRITVYHAAAPTCWWSWGYEPVLHRIRQVYGDQVAIRLTLGTPWEDLQEYYAHYGLDFKGVQAWQEEAAALMGVPMRRFARESELPASLAPATQAVLAAFRQGHAPGERLLRELLRLFLVDGRDVTRSDVVLDAARAVGLDVGRFKRDFADEAGLQHDLERLSHGFPAVGFYNLAVSDGNGRTVLLDHAFDPAVVEDAIDHLARGRLEKEVPRDVLSFLNANGPASEVELQRVFGAHAAQPRLEALAKDGRIERVALAGQAGWAPVRA